MIKFIQDIRGAIDHVKKSVDLLKVVEDELGKPTKTSGRDHMWCCPFHQEKTPSFGVHDGMQIIKCFGCGVGGDLFVFVQNYYGLSMVEAIQFTAMKYGVDIAAFEREPTPEEAERHRYIQIQNEVASFCTKQLLANQSMKDWFMKDTGFNIEQIVDYDVGYSQAPDTIATHLHSVFKDMTQSELDKLELTKRTMWTDALVYAIRDPHGSVLRFYNKPLSPPPDLGGKYLGTSTNHPLFTNKLLYGFHNVRKTLKDTRFSIRLVEGQKAAIASGAVAVLGSSIKAEQIELLKEYKIREVRICFDGDEAGRAASLKLLDISGSFDDIHVLVGKMPTDVQPDDLAKTSKAALDKVFEDAALPVEYFIDTKRDATGAISTRDKFGLIRDLKEHLSSISPVQMDMTAKYLSEVLSVDEESVRSFVSDLKSTKSTLSNKDVEQAVLYHVMMNPNYWSTTSHAITNPKAFTVMAAQKLFQAILSAHKKVRAISTATDVTVQVIRDEVSVLFPQYPDLVAYVDSILSSRPKYEFIDGLNRVCDLARRREGIEQSKIFMSLLNDMGKATGDVVSKYRRSLVSTLDVRKDSSSTPSQLANALMKEMHERSLRQGQVIGHDFSTLVDVDGQKIPSLTGLCLAMSGLQKQHQVVVSANSGCHAIGQGILMYNGEIKKVEDVIVGDQLMGPDSSPRNVLALARGVGKMVRIYPNKGDSFVVNEDHILTLVHTHLTKKTCKSRRIKYVNHAKDTLVDMTVKEYLALPKSAKVRLKLVKTGVDFAQTRAMMPIDPYFMGVLLGDGAITTATAVTVGDADPQIADEVISQAKRLGLHVRTTRSFNKKLNRPTRAVSMHLHSGVSRPGSNILKNALVELGIFGLSCGNKYIPSIYKTASRQDRLNMLAGLIDTDGSLSHGCYDYISKSAQLSNDVAYLARSLGLAATVAKCTKSAVGTGFTGEYYRVCISGSIHIVPCRLPRKQAVVGRSTKNRLYSGFTVAPEGTDRFYGFTLDADGRFLLDDFTITHNTGKSLLTLQMATSMAICPDPSDRIPTLWIPLEMNAMETTMRIVSLVSGVDNNKVQGARLTRDEALKVRKASEMIAAGQLYIEKPRTGSIDEIFSIIDEYHFKYGIKAVFLDYIQLIAPGDADRGASREEVIGRASKVMKNQVAEGLGMVSVSIAQQNRMNFKLGEVSKIENVGGSYQIAQDADDFITMSEKTAEQMTEEKHMRGNRKLFIDKRRGGSSDVMIDLMLDTMTYSLRFREMLSLAELQGLARSTGVEDNNQV